MFNYYLVKMDLKGNELAQLELEQKIDGLAPEPTYFNALGKKRFYVLQTEKELIKVVQTTNPFEEDPDLELKAQVATPSAECYAIAYAGTAQQLWLADAANQELLLIQLEY
jgi:hypothetical protein